MLQSWHFLEAFPIIDEEGGDNPGADGVTVAVGVVV
jgi:hypothetical protein